MSIPLVQKAEKDDINTSIIAIKRNIERINMLLGLSNSEEIDTSEFVKKSDIVDEVTVGNMQSVTSNAVAKLFKPIVQINGTSTTSYTCTKNGLHTFIVTLWVNQGMTDDIYVNNKNIGYAYYSANSGLYQITTTVTLMLAIGDIVSVSTTRGSSRIRVTSIVELNINQ
jgi:hypothetical protein